ncbi:MAG: hypothetical protein U0930_20155 [Pirellulales bacterium]
MQSTISLGERVKKAKDLLAQGTPWPRGCSAFVCLLLDIDWQDANSLMGDNPKYVGKDGNYTQLVSGDIVGWKKTGGHGHVAVYIGEPEVTFIDVNGEGASPRRVRSYGDQEVYKSSLF